MTPNQIATVLSILNRNDQAVGRAMVILLSYQTIGERAAGVTVEDNGVGFSAATDINGTYFAKWVLGLPSRSDVRHMSAAIDRFLKSNQPGRPLTGKFLARAREIATLHRRQLRALLPKDEQIDPRLLNSYDDLPPTVRYVADQM